MSGIVTFEGATILQKWKPSLSDCPNPIKSALIYTNCLKVLSTRFPSLRSGFGLQTDSMINSVIELLNSVPNNAVKRAILIDTGEEGNTVLDLASAHLEVLRGLDGFITDRCRYGESNGLELRKGYFMQTSFHFLKTKELNRKLIIKGVQSYQFHTFRESLFMKYYLHVFFTMIAFIPLQIAIQDINF